MLALLLLCYSCDEAELPFRPYYKLVANAPLLDASSATFSATVSGVEGDEIIERGFVVVRNFIQNNSPSRVLEDTYPVPLNEEFECRFGQDWEVGTNGTVYAYMNTKGQKYRSETVRFSPSTPRKPIIHSVTPKSNDKGYGTMIVLGENFTTMLSRVRVYLNDVLCTVKTVGMNELVVGYSVSQIGYYDVKVCVGDEDGTMEKGFCLEGPKLVSVSSSDIYSGLELTIDLDGFDAGIAVNVIIGDSDCTILEKSTNKIRCICPRFYPGMTSVDLFLYFPDKMIKTDKYPLSIRDLWTFLGVYSSSLGWAYFIHENEGYSWGWSEIRHYNKSKNSWEDLTRYTNYVYPTFIFSNGQYLYVVGDENSESAGVVMYTYHLSTGVWAKSQHLVPKSISGYSSGHWINGEYYLCDPYNGVSLMKYTPNTDTWTVLNDHVGNPYRLFAVGNKVYALFANSLYEYNVAQQVRGQLVYEFPSRFNIVSYDIRCNGNLFYFFSGGVFFSFDLELLELKLMGCPYGYYSSYDFILPFHEGVYVGTSASVGDGNVYKYIGTE